MYAITGATGQLGRLVIEALLQHVPPAQIIAAVRSPAKAADLATRGIVVREADYERPDTLTAAFAGARKVLLISGSEIGRRVPQHAAVIAAAKAAAVDLLAYTSVLRADTSLLSLAAEHKATEDLVTESGLPSVILRNGWYTENYTAALAPALQHGVLIGSAGSGRISSAARADYAQAAANVLLQSAPEGGRIYELAGDDSYTLADFAAEVSRQTGRPLTYQTLPEAAYAEALIGAGLPAAFAALIAQSDAAAAQGALFDDGKALSHLIGRPTTPWADVIAATLKA